MEDNASNQKDEYINAKDLNLNFRYDLSEKLHAESLLNCIQCGVCSSGCQVSEWMDLQPHLVVSSLLLGMKNRILSSRAIWSCSICHRCTERCPKSVNYSFLLAHLRNMAMESGNVPIEYKSDLENVYLYGFALPLNDAMKKSLNRRRLKINLPEITEPDLDSIKKIIESMGLNKLLEAGDE
ncbi:MAG: 4Fe-4S dicluster domain-containing protein [Candidatus Hodarchaeota archaeon]